MKPNRLDAVDPFLSGIFLPPKKQVADDAPKKNCGVGSDGFEAGNDCGAGDGSGGGSSGDVRKVTSEIFTDAPKFVDAAKKQTESGFSSPDSSSKLKDALIEYQTTQLLFTDSGEINEEDLVSASGTLARFGYNDFLRGDEKKESMKTAAKTMRTQLEVAVTESRIATGVTLARGLAIEKDALDSIIKSGSITHTALNSWSTDPKIAEGFGGVGDLDNSVVLVLKNPSRGFFTKPSASSEVLRPPSSMRVTKVTKTSNGHILEVEEDERLK